MNKKYGAFSSSIDPQQFSLTISSALKIIGVVVGGVLAMKGINFSISDVELKQISDAVVLIVTSGFSIWHAGEFLFGFVRKFTHKD